MRLTTGSRTESESPIQTADGEFVMESSRDDTQPSIRSLGESVDRIGPILFFRGWHDGHLELAALLVRPVAEEPPTLTAEDATVSPETLHKRDGLAVLRYAFSLATTGNAAYWIDSEHYELAAGVEGDLRIAYVACNGQENGDRERAPDERNALWRRLADQHATAPVNLLLQGGDQLYADEMLDAHPAVRAWGDHRETPAGADDDIASIRETLRSYMLERYVELYSQPAPAWLMARVPSLCMWDDHDICDGWGSLPLEQLNAPIGQAVFDAAREFFLLFQFGAHPDNLPAMFPDQTGATLTWGTRLPGVALLAPDLRSERRPNRIMGEAGRAAFEKTLDAVGEERVLLLSSVPALGPRLSWMEAVMLILPGMQKYEDDLRDQWQSRSHREEWRRFLNTILGVHERSASPVTILSGEIHLATRGTMASATGPVHQLVSSGITHPPPPQAYARCLSALARLGEAPLPNHPIRLHSLPGQRNIYTAQRNYLMLERINGQWSAYWQLGRDGATPRLSLEE